MKTFKNILSLILLTALLVSSLSLSVFAESGEIPAKSTWTIAASTYIGGCNPEKAIDGNNKTYWHSYYEVENGSAVNPVLVPYYIYVTLPSVTEFSGINITPRADSGAQINEISVYVSDTAADSNTDTSWALIADKVAFETPTVGDQTPLNIDFGMNVKAKRFMLAITKTSNNYGTIAEIDLAARNDRYTVASSAELLEYHAIKNNTVLSDKSEWEISVNSGEGSIRKAIDGIVADDNYWHSYFTADGATITYHDIPPYYVYITFPEKTVISHLDVIPRQDIKNGCPLEINFYAADSDEGEMYLLEEKLTYESGYAARVIDLASNIAAKKILINITGGNGGYGCISEINITGNDEEKPFSALDTYIDTAKYARKYEISKNYFEISCDHTGNWSGNVINNMIDGSESTIWQTDNLNVLGVQVTKPTVTVDMLDDYTISEITYFPRQSDDHHGHWTKFTLQTSSDGVSYTNVADYTFALGYDLQVIELDNPIKCRYIRFKSITGNGGYVGGGELYFYQTYDGLYEYNERYGGTFHLEYGSAEVYCERGAAPGDYTLDGPIEVKDGTTYVPLLSFVNQLIYKGNATEDKTNDLRKITVSLNGGLKTFTLQENNHFVYSLDNKYGDVRYTMYKLPYVKNDIIYVPLHFLCELVGYEESYDGETLTLVKVDFNMYDTVEWIDPAKSFATYKVNYDLGLDGIGTIEDGREYDEVKVGTGVLLPSVETEIGYKFEGWYYPGRIKLLAGMGEEAYNPASDVTLYAAYTEIENLDDIKAEMISLLKETDLSLYRTAERKEIEAIIASAEKNINSSETKEEINDYYLLAKEAIDAVETDEEMTKAEDETGLKLTVTSTSGGYVTKDEEPISGTVVVAAGANVTLKAYPDTGTGTFKAWIDGTTKKVLSLETEYVFDMYSKRHIIALFTDGSLENEVFASFITRNNQYAKYTYVEKGTDTNTVAPDEKQMYVTGYTFNGWNPGLGVINKNTDYKGNYEKEINTYTVTVKGGSEIDNGSEFTAEYNDVYIVKADVPAKGLVFAGWKLNGQLVSYDEEYSFGVFNDIELEATFAKSVVKNPLVVMLDAAKNIYNGSNIASFMADVYLPGEMTFIEAGILYAKTKVDKGTLVISNLGTTIDGKEIKRTIVTKDTMFKLTASYGELGITARGYLIYLDENGEKKTIYTDTTYIVEEATEDVGGEIEEDVDFDL